MMKSKLAKQIVEVLQNDERTAESAIEANDANGVITLMGTAPSHEARRIAGELTAAQPGVISVTNEVTVIESDITDGIPTGALALGVDPAAQTT